MGTVATPLDRSLKLVSPKDESGVEEGLALITQLMSGLTAVYKAQQQDQEADEGSTRSSSSTAAAAFRTPSSKARVSIRCSSGRRR